MVPAPPARLVPPMITAAITSNSSPSAMFDEPAMMREDSNTAANAARKPMAPNVVIRVRPTRIRIVEPLPRCRRRYRPIGHRRYACCNMEDSEDHEHDYDGHGDVSRVRPPPQKLNGSGKGVIG